MSEFSIAHKVPNLSSAKTYVIILIQNARKVRYNIHAKWLAKSNSLKEKSIKYKVYKCNILIQTDT